MNTLLIKDVKSEKEIYQEAVAEWTGVLTQLYDAIGKPVDKKQLAVFIKQLGRVPLGLLEQAISEILQNHSYNNVPTLGEIWKAIKDISYRWYAAESAYWGTQLNLDLVDSAKPVEVLTNPDLPSAYDMVDAWWATYGKGL
jgi:hypothetical protein